MQSRLIHSLAALTLLLTAAMLITGCASNKSAKEQAVTPAQLSPPARATVDKVTAGGRVDKITKEVERGRTVYDVEATVGGQHMEYLIADSNGELLGTEVPIEFSQLPEPVRSAAEKFFGTTTGLTAMKGVEYGETQYEIEGTKNGRKFEISLDPQGNKGK